jgi:hypothetical protein
MGVCVVLQPSTPLHETHGEFSILKTNTEYVEKVTPPPTHTHKPPPPPLYLDIVGWCGDKNSCKTGNTSCYEKGFQ